MLGVMGPRSRALLASLSSDDWSEDGFPFATSREVTVAGVAAAGDPDDVRRRAGLGAAGAGRRRGDGVRRRPRRRLRCDAGYYAIESLRLEKGYRAFGRELTPDYAPVEAGLVFATALTGDKDFLGPAGARGAPRRSCTAGGPRRRLVSFVVESPEPMLWGGELLLRDGVPAGQVTSAAWGETVGAVRGAGATCATTVRSPRTWLGRGRLRGRRRGGAVRRSGLAARAAGLTPDA